MSMNYLRTDFLFIIFYDAASLHISEAKWFVPSNCVNENCVFVHGECHD